MRIKHYIVTLFCLTLLAALLAPMSARAQSGAEGWLPFDTAAAPAPPTLALYSATLERIDLVADFPGVETETLTVAGRPYTRLFGEGYGYSADLGLPNVPVLRRFVEIPFGATVTLEILSAEYVDVSLAELGLHPIYPTQPQVEKLPGATPPFQRDAAFYADGSRYPAAPATLGESYIARGHRIQPVAVAPVAYDPGAGTLRLYQSLTVRLRLVGSDAALTQARAERYAAPSLTGAFSRDVLNYNQGRSLPAVKATEGYLIITADAYASAMQPFVTLKQGQGFAVTLTPLSAIPNGSTNTGIKAYIQTAYDTWPTPPAYVLLVGDTDTLPGWASQAAGEITDLYYATMDGADDWHPDIGRGRFPVRSAAQATYIVNKYVAYAGLSDEDWLDWASFIGTCDNYQVAEGSHNYVINTHTEPEGYVGTFPNNPQPGGDRLYCITHNADEEDIIAAVNEGRVMTIYSGHGGHDGWEMGYGQDDVEAITSYGVFPFVASHACITNDFEEPEVFGETWVLQENKGALVFWGSSDSSYWGPDDTLERAMFDALFGEGPQPTVAAMTDSGLTATEATYPGDARYYWETYNILGDPALKLFLEPGEPTFTMEVTPATYSVCNATPTSSNGVVHIDSVLNYAGTVTLLSGVLPNDVSVSFAPQAAAAPFTSALTLTVGAAAPAGAHTLVISATDYAANTQQADVQLQIVNSIANTPTLTTPANGASNVSSPVAFRWEEDSLASGYHLQLASHPYFDDPAVDVPHVPTAQYSLTTPLAGGACYWWRVRADNACGEGLWAAPFYFSTPLLDIAFSDAIESGAGQWTHAAAVGADEWAIVTDAAHSPTHAWHVPDAAVTTDSALRLSAPVAVGAGSALSFWHRHQFEGDATFYDGGVLEISTNGGATWSDMGAYLTANGYNGTLHQNNALGARPAWVADLTTWTQVTADLSAFAGQNILLRWRLGCDSGGGDVGWYIDDVQITAPLPPSPAPTLDAIVPAGGTPFAPTPVQLTGSHFSGAPNVLLDGPGLEATWLLSVTLVNSRTLDAVAPAGLPWGTYTVTLFNGDCGQAVLPAAFTVVGACDISPTVTLASPGVVELDDAPDFTAIAAGTQPLRYAWDFGGAGTGSDLNTATPTYYYAAPGLYTVAVTVTDPCGDSAVATTTVEIICIAPTVAASVDPASVEIGQEHSFTAAATGTGPLIYEWDFGGEGAGTGLETATPRFTYAAAGVYTATVTVAGPCGAVSDAVTVEVTCTPPTVSAAVDAAIVNQGTAQNFTAVAAGSGPFTYAWDFGGAGNGSGADTATPRFTYAAAGAYTATVTVAGPCGAVSDTLLVTVTCDLPEVSLTADATTVELGGEIRLNAIATSTRALSYAWDFGGDGVVRDRYTTHPAVTYAAPGVYTVTVTATDACGSVQATLSVAVICYPPQVTLDGPATVELGRPAQFAATVLSGTAPFTYTWDFGGAGEGSGLNTARPTFIYATPGTYTPTVTVSNRSHSAQAGAGVTVMSYAPQVTLEALAPVALGQVIRPTATVLSGTAPFTYTWDFGGAGEGSGLDTLAPSFQYDAPGVYTVTLTVTNVGNAVQAEAEARVYQPLTDVALTGPALVAAGETVTFSAAALPLTATTPITLVWDNGAVGPTAVYSWTTAGVYTPTVVAIGDYNAVTASAGRVTVFAPVRILSLQSTGPVTLGMSLRVTAVLTGAAPYTCTWDFGGAGSGAGLDTPTPVFTYTEAGRYTVTLTATHAYPAVAVQRLEVEVLPEADEERYGVFLPLVIRQ